MENAVKKEPKSLSDILREQLKGVLDAAAGFLLKLGFTANALTILGLVGHIAAAFLLYQGKFTWAGILLLAMVLADVVDGPMARLQGNIQPFGSFLDSVADRYAELVTFGGLLLYFSTQDNMLACVLVYLAMIGSLMVSYTRAKAESIGVQAKNGIMTRLERYLVLIPSLLFNFPVVGVGIIAVLANFTAVQRILRTWRDSRIS